MAGRCHMAATARRGLATGSAASAINRGPALMAIAAAGFIGYALLFLVRSFTDSFLELGIGPAEVGVGKGQIQQVSPSLYHYISHLHIAVSGFIAAAGFAVLMLAVKGMRAGQVWAWGTAVATPRAGAGGGAARPLPMEPGHPRSPWPHLPGRGRLPGRRGAVR